MSTYYIGADVHNNSTELAIEKRGKIVARYSVPTSIPAIINVLDSLQGKKYLAVEEGPMSGWLHRNLNAKLDQFISSDPRRNKLIASDGDKDDKIDAAKLASLLRGGFLRAVYHSDDDGRAELKHWVSLYHDRVRDAVRSINKIRARCRMHGRQNIKSGSSRPSQSSKLAAENKAQPFMVLMTPTSPMPMRTLTEMVLIICVNIYTLPIPMIMAANPHQV